MQGCRTYILPTARIAKPRSDRKTAPNRSVIIDEVYFSEENHKKAQEQGYKLVFKVAFLHFHFGEFLHFQFGTNTPMNGWNMRGY